MDCQGTFPHSIAGQPAISRVWAPGQYLKYKSISKFIINDKKSQKQLAFAVIINPILKHQASSLETLRPMMPSWPVPATAPHRPSLAAALECSLPTVAPHTAVPGVWRYSALRGTTQSSVNREASVSTKLGLVNAIHTAQYKNICFSDRIKHLLDRSGETDKSSRPSTPRVREIRACWNSQKIILTLLVVELIQNGVRWREHELRGGKCHH